MGFTVDQAISNAQPPVWFAKAGTAPKAANIWVDLWGCGGGMPSVGAFNSSLNGAVLTNVTQGGLRYTNAVSASYLLKLAASSSQTGTLMLYDRIWQNGGIGITTTTAQSITTPTIPRDIANSNNGAGLIVGMEMSATSTNGTVTNTTLAYTGDDGNTGTATIASYIASATANTFVPFAYDATKNHNGIRAISSLTLGTTYTTGTANLAIIRPIAIVNVTTAGLVYSADLATSGFPQIFSGSVLGMMWMSPNTTAPSIDGLMVITQN